MTAQWSRDAHVDNTIKAIDACDFTKAAKIAESWEARGWDLEELKDYWVPTKMINALDDLDTIKGTY